MRVYGARIGGGILVLMMATLCLLPGPGIADATAAQPDTGSIKGRVFLDENADTFFKECDCDCGLGDIPVRLYRDHCGGLIVQTVKTDEQGWFHFLDLKPGDYCVMPNAKMICEGYQATKSLTQKVHVSPGEEIEAEWFGLDHFIDINE